LEKFENVPIAGGIEALEKKYRGKNSWRGKKFQNRISRQGRVCKAMKQKMEDETMTVGQLCNDWEPLFAEDCNKSLQKFIDLLHKPKADGGLEMLTKKQNRGRK